MTLLVDQIEPWAPDERQLQRLANRRPRLSERLPVLLPLAVQVHRARRRMNWLSSDAKWAGRRTAVDLDVLVRGHDSVLLRQLGESDMKLQHSKITNLRLAAAKLDGLLIDPGETFSFNKVVGNCTRRAGYVDGMRLSRGAVVPGVGGGICQLANVVHWLVLHSSLTVTERSEHSVDPFPDEGRVVPWGTGCSIVYNYVDLQVRNDTASSYQLRVSVGDTHLSGELRSNAPQQRGYAVYAANERFHRRGATFFRANQIYRTVTDEQSGERLGEELVRSNCAVVRYLPLAADVHELPMPASRRLSLPSAP